MLGFSKGKNIWDQFSGPISLFGGSYCELEGPEPDVDHPSLSRAKGNVWRYTSTPPYTPRHKVRLEQTEERLQLTPSHIPLPPPSPQLSKNIYSLVISKWYNTSAIIRVVGYVLSEICVYHIMLPQMIVNYSHMLLLMGQSNLSSYKQQNFHQLTKKSKSPSVCYRALTPWQNFCIWNYRQSWPFSPSVFLTLKSPN